MVLRLIADHEDLRAEICDLKEKLADIETRCVDRSEVATMIDERLPRTADEWLACLGGCVLAEAVPEMPRAHVGSGRP